MSQTALMTKEATPLVDTRDYGKCPKYDVEEHSSYNTLTLVWLAVIGVPLGRNTELLYLDAKASGSQFFREKDIKRMSLNYDEVIAAFKGFIKKNNIPVAMNVEFYMYPQDELFIFVHDYKKKLVKDIANL